MILQAFTVTALGILAASLMHFRRRKRLVIKDKKQVPRVLRRTSSGYVDSLETFSDYVARQLGFVEKSECRYLRKLASDYLKQSKECEENTYAFFSNDPNAESLYLKLVDEFDRCILAYFAFHWSQASNLISLVLSDDPDQPKRKLKNVILAATRKQRFERVIKDLKVTRVFSTLVDEMKAIGRSGKEGEEESERKEVMVPASHNQRSPVLLLMGGGMGAGKSTVLKDILTLESFWSDAAAKAVVVEADAFRETDVIYRALNSKGRHHDMLQTAELVHQSSTDAASSLLVTALNEGRDVVMDGTLSWPPFVEQTINMARNIHHHRYRMGVGYKVSDDGSIIENYWEQIPENGKQEEQEPSRSRRKPYRIELVGVVCDAYLAVVRGIRRAVITGRAVRVNSQLKSHKRFASAFAGYAQLVDNARLFCTNAMGGPPKLIAWKDGEKNMLVDPEDIEWLKRLSTLNDEADSIHELYPDDTHLNSIWNDVVVSPTRATQQHELKVAIQELEIKSM